MNKKLIFVFVFAILIGSIFAQYVKITKLSSTLQELSSIFNQYKELTDEAIGENYLLHTISARQIRTLFNLRLRDQSPEIQKRMEEERKKYEDLEKKEDEENK